MHRFILYYQWGWCINYNCNVKNCTSVGTEYKPHEMHISKLLLFNILAILHTTVTLIGAGIFGIDISNILLFVFSCYFVSVVFRTVAYSLISVFGEVGKGIAILLVLFQISGSGGIYPIEIMSNLFGVIYHYLPMIHGITIVRESQLGVIWTNYLPSFAFLLILGVIVILYS